MLVNFDVLNKLVLHLESELYLCFQFQQKLETLLFFIHSLKFGNVIA